MSDTRNPDDFVITRRRKKYKFAKFYNASNCFECDEWVKRPVDVIEIGAGTGMFSVELATRHPELAFVALDVKADRLQKGAYEALARGLTNIFFIRARADQINQLFDPASLSAVWLTFPDPFPKRRSAGRRLTHPSFLALYAAHMKPGATMHLKHDNPEFFGWSLEQLVILDWHMTELSFDLHDSSLDDDYKILTDYERRWLREGLKTNFVTALPRL